MELVDRAAARVLRQKCDLGLLDEDWPGLDAAEGSQTARSSTSTRPGTAR